MSGDSPEGGAPPGSRGGDAGGNDFTRRGTFASASGREDEAVPSSGRVPPPPPVPRLRAGSIPPAVPAPTRKATLPGAIPPPAPMPRIPDVDAMIEASSRPSAPPGFSEPDAPPPIPRFLTPLPAPPVLPPSASSGADSAGATRRKSRRTVKIPDDNVPVHTPPPPVTFEPIQAFTPEPFGVIPAPPPASGPVLAATLPSVTGLQIPDAAPSSPDDARVTPIVAAPVVVAAPEAAAPGPFARASTSPVPPRFTAPAPIELPSEAVTPPLPAVTEDPVEMGPIQPMRIINIGTSLPPPEEDAVVDVAAIEAAALASDGPVTPSPIAQSPAALASETTPIAAPRKPPPPPPVSLFETIEAEPAEPDSVDPVSLEPEPASPPAVSAAPRKPPPVPKIEAVEAIPIDTDDEPDPTTQRGDASAEAAPRGDEIEEIEVERISEVTEGIAAGPESGALAKKPPPPPPKRTSIEPSGPISISPAPPPVRSGPPPAPPVSARPAEPMPVSMPAAPIISAPPAPMIAAAPATPPPVSTPTPPPAAAPSAGPATVDPLRKRQKPWWEEIFGDDFTRTMDKVDPKVVRKECDFIEDRLGLEKGAVMLDLACGPGSHAIELSSRGYSVVGYDLSLSMLARAADEAQERGQRLNFLHGDMREMAFEETFDGVYCWQTSFGYFEDDKNLDVLKRIHKALRKGGLLLLDVVNHDYVAPRQPSLVWFEGDGCVCMDEMVVDFFSSRLRVKRTVMFDDGRARELDYGIRLYALHELGKMLHDCGFKVLEVTGHPAHPGVFFGSESPRIIILAERG